MTAPPSPPSPPPPDVAVGAPAAPAAPSLDPLALARLRELDPDGRHDIVGRVLRTYETSLAQALPQFAALAAAGDARGLRELAHKMKSGSAAVGAPAFAEACAELERRLRAGEAVPLGDAAAALQTLGEAALSAVRNMLRGP